MRVLIDTTYSRRAPFSGTAVYVRKLCEQLGRRDDIELIEVFNRRRRLPAGGGIGSVRNLLVDRWWAGVELPRLARRAGADIVHHPLPAHARWASLPQVVTVVDLAFERLPDHFDPGFRFYAHRSHRAAALASAAVICISETTAADVRELWRVPSERIVVAALGPGQELAGNGVQREHFLYVGDGEPRKNVGTLLAAYELYRESTESPLSLVLAGSVTATLPGIIVAHRPTPERLAELYRGAVALVHPSLYEGFGLTALEAMAAGVPVVAADAPGVSEVCGDAACYADPHSPGSFAAAMARVAEDAAFRADLAERGRRRAAEFSWDRCARAHVDAYSLATERA
jgi:glycosyltransferase involved in cell wall biosynthesis